MKQLFEYFTLKMQRITICHWLGQEYYIIHGVLKMLKLQNKIEKSLDSGMSSFS